MACQLILFLVLKEREMPVIPANFENEQIETHSADMEILVPILAGSAKNLIYVYYWKF